MEPATGHDDGVDAEAGRGTEAVERNVDEVVPQRDPQGAPLVHDDVPGNVSVTLRMGNADAVEPAFVRAQHVARLALVNNRITAVTMEPRGCIAEYDAGTGRYTLYTSTQNVHGLRQALAHLEHLVVSCSSFSQAMPDFRGTK